MYQDAGYGDNWQREGDNARRFDPYTRSCTVLISLFAVGFVLIVIIVLSLIPIYISRKSAHTSNMIQTTKILITNYNLQLQFPSDRFEPNTILTNTNNRIALQAALTSMLQNDSVTTGSIVEIGSSTSQSRLIRRQISDLYNITFNLNITHQKQCITACGHQYHSRVVDLLTNANHTRTLFVRYQQSNNTEVYWLDCRLPQTVNSNFSLVYVDPKTIASLLSTLLSIDNLQNEPTIETSTSDLLG